MPPSSSPEETRAAVTARYSGLARTARSGQQIHDCGPDDFEAGCFGAAGYDDTSELPDGAVRASPLLIVGTAQPHGEVRALTGRQQLGSAISQTADGGQIDSPERGEPVPKQIIERLAEDCEN